MSCASGVVAGARRGRRPASAPRHDPHEGGPGLVVAARSAATTGRCGTHWPVPRPAEPVTTPGRPSAPRSATFGPGNSRPPATPSARRAPADPPGLRGARGAPRSRRAVLRRYPGAAPVAGGRRWRASRATRCTRGPSGASEAGWTGAEDVVSGNVAVVERDEPGGYSSWSPELPGCVAAAGDYDKCLQSMTEAVQRHVEGLRADGVPVPEPTALAAVIVPAA